MYQKTYICIKYKFARKLMAQVAETSTSPTIMGVPEN